MNPESEIKMPLTDTFHGWLLTSSPGLVGTITRYEWQFAQAMEHARSLERRLTLANQQLKLVTEAGMELVKAASRFGDSATCNELNCIHKVCKLNRAITQFNSLTTKKG